uniref:Uncharacterized protein n=1 Tax=Chenopodium quinoa TaxID=63459 RepID=A0A803NEF4_CHEQI
MSSSCFFFTEGLNEATGGGEDIKPRLKSSEIVEVQLDTNWDDISCPVCLDYPHNSVLLQCSSYDKGCRSYVCDTNHLHSNCLDRFKTAYGIPSQSNSPPTSFQWEMKIQLQ